LPVRIGVFVLSALSAVSGGLSAFAIWYTVVRTAKYGTVDSAMSSINWNTTTSVNGTDWQSSLDSIALDKSQYYAFIVIGVIVSIYTLFSILGFIGSIARNRAMVAFYSTALWFLLVINILVGVYYSYSAIHRRSDLARQCDQQTANNQNGLVATEEYKLTTAACNAASKVGVVVAIVIVVVELLIQLYCCIIVKRYVEQLSEEQGYSRQMAGNRVSKGAAGAGAYYPHMPLGSQHELMPAPGGAYAYGQQDHSFGSKV